MRLSTSIELFNYWNGTRGAADAPLRSDIDPGAIRHILPQIFILEADGGPRFRLAGTTICGLFGRELRDAPFSSLWTGGQADDATRLAIDVMEHTVPVLINATGRPPYGRASAFEIILLPMFSSPGRCDRLLGGLVPTTSVLPGSQSLTSLRLDRHRPLDRNTGQPEPEPVKPISQGAPLARKGMGLTQAVLRALHL